MRQPHQLILSCGLQKEKFIIRDLGRLQKCPPVTSYLLSMSLVCYPKLTLDTCDLLSLMRTSKHDVNRGLESVCTLGLTLMFLSEILRLPNKEIQTSLLKYKTLYKVLSKLRSSQTNKVPIAKHVSENILDDLVPAELTLKTLKNGQANP